MMSMTSFCRQWIPNYSLREASLSAMVHGKQLSVRDKLSGLLKDLRAALTVAPTLGLPNPNMPFTRFVDLCVTPTSQG